MSLAETVLTAFIDRKLAQPHTPRPVPETRSLAKGLIAGVVAGIAATAAKAAVEKIYPPSSTALVPANHQPNPTAHWAFAATTGAAYGALAEFYPIAASRDGVNFGMTLMALTHETGDVPAETTRSKTSEIASHVVFGLVAETTRRLVRRML